MANIKVSKIFDKSSNLLAREFNKEESNMSEYKAYFVIRKDINISPAKLAVQVGHGCDFIHTVSDIKYKNHWLNDRRAKIVVSIDNIDKLNKLEEKLINDKIGYNTIIDAGLTEFNGPTLTGIVIFPLKQDETPTYLKRLRLYYD